MKMSIKKTSDAYRFSEFLLKLAQTSGYEEEDDEILSEITSYILRLGESLGGQEDKDIASISIGLQIIADAYENVKRNNLLLGSSFLKTFAENILESKEKFGDNEDMMEALDDISYLVFDKEINDESDLSDLNQITSTDSLVGKQVAKLKSILKNDEALQKALTLSAESSALSLQLASEKKRGKTMEELVQEAQNKEAGMVAGVQSEMDELTNPSLSDVSSVANDEGKVNTISMGTAQSYSGKFTARAKKELDTLRKRIQLISERGNAVNNDRLQIKLQNFMDLKQSADQLDVKLQELASLDLADTGDAKENQRKKKDLVERIRDIKHGMSRLYSVNRYYRDQNVDQSLLGIRLTDDPSRNKETLSAIIDNMVQDIDNDPSFVGKLSDEDIVDPRSMPSWEKEVSPPKEFYLKWLRVMKDKLLENKPENTKIVYNIYQKIKMILNDKGIEVSVDRGVKNYYINGNPTVFSSLAKLSLTMNDYFAGNGHFYLHAVAYALFSYKQSKSANPKIIAELERRSKEVKTQISGKMKDRVLFLLERKKYLIEIINEMADKIEKGQLTSSQQFDQIKKKETNSRDALSIIINEIGRISAALNFFQHAVKQNKAVYDIYKEIEKSFEQAGVSTKFLTSSYEEMMPDLKLFNTDKVKIAEIAKNLNDYNKQLAEVRNKIDKKASEMKAFNKYILGVNEQSYISPELLERVVEDEQAGEEEFQRSLQKALDMFGKNEADRLRQNKNPNALLTDKVQTESTTSVVKYILENAEVEESLRTVRHNLVDLQSSIKAIQEKTNIIKQRIESGKMGAFQYEGELGKSIREKINLNRGNDENQLKHLEAMNKENKELYRSWTDAMRSFDKITKRIAASVPGKDINTQSIDNLIGNFNSSIILLRGYINQLDTIIRKYKKDSANFESKNKDGKNVFTFNPELQKMER
jgi:uncharacterized coiled-coil protein SlyX